MGLQVEPRITHTSQSNRGTQGHHLPYPLLRKSRDGVPMRLVMETVGKVMQGIGLYLKSQFTEHGRDTMPALR